MSEDKSVMILLRCSEWTAYEGDIDIAARDREIEALQRSLAACKLHDLEAAWQR